MLNVVTFLIPAKKLSPVTSNVQETRSTLNYTTEVILEQTFTAKNITSNKLNTPDKL